MSCEVSSDTTGGRCEKVWLDGWELDAFEEELGFNEVWFKVWLLDTCEVDFNEEVWFEEVLLEEV